MKKIRTIFSVMALALAAYYSVAEEDKRSPLGAYRADTQFWLSMCGIKFISTTTLIEMGRPVTDDVNYTACIQEGSGSLKTSLVKILKKTKKPALVAAIKDYHVAVSTALEGIKPGVHERKISYEQRQESLKEKVTQALARIDVEE